MFTSDDLEAAGRRAATHPVETVPDVADIQREVTRRRQSKRLLVGASAATALLFAIGGGLLLRSGNDQVQVITASPVLESTVTPASSEVAGREADTDRTDDGDIVKVEDTDRSRETDDRDDSARGDRADDDDRASSSSADDEGESGKSTYTKSPEDDAAEGDDRTRSDEDWDHDGDLFLDPSEYIFPEDFEQWLKQLEGHEWPDDEFSNGFEFWPLPLGRFDVEVSLGDEAVRRAKQAAASADDEFIVEDRTLWISRQTRRDTVTVSSLIEDDWYVAATGPADQEKVLIRLISQHDGNWEDRITAEDLEWLRKRDWLSWPPTHDDWEEWNDAREDWLDEHEDALKEARERVEEQRKKVEEERKRIEEERKRIEEERKNNDGNKDEDDEDDDD